MSNLTALPVLGEASYGDGTTGGTHVFNSSTLTTGFRITPVLDSAGRTVTHLKYAISVSEWLEPATGDVNEGTDDVVEAAIQILSQPAGFFVWTNRGPGGLRINTGEAAATNDLLWGPIPTVIAVTPRSNQTVRIDWSVDLAIVACADGVSQGQVMEYNYTMDYHLDAERITTRRYSGFIRIPMTRGFPGSRKLPDSADVYRSQVVPTIPVGFVRVEDDYQLDESKQKLTFNVVDKQMPPNAWPPGVVNAKARHRYNNTPGKINHWTGTIEAELTMARGVGVGPAITAFFAILQNPRLASAQTIRVGEGLFIPGPGGGIPAPAPLGGPVTIRPYAFELEEPEVWGPGETKVRISCSYLVIGGGLGGILRAGGLWTPTATTWGAWMTSVALPYGPRGSANLIFKPNDETILDLCQPGLEPTPPPSSVGGP